MECKMKRLLKKIFKRFKKMSESTIDHMPLEVEGDSEKIRYHKTMELKSRISRIRKTQISEGNSPCYCDNDRYVVQPYCDACSFKDTCTVVE